jgi:curved DNA-binding protein
MFGGGAKRDNRTNFRGQDFNAEMQLDSKDVYKTNQKVFTVNGKNIRLTIPAGLENGQTIKIKGYGGEGVNGAPKGDSNIKFTISNQTAFKRDGNNQLPQVDLDIYTAVLGGELMVNTFDGKVKLKVAAETQNGTKVKLKGKGFLIYKKENKYSELYITYQLALPNNISTAKKELFTQLVKLRRS